MSGGSRAFGELLAVLAFGWMAAVVIGGLLGLIGTAIDMAMSP
jgi:hypothetical protein